jgi:hypothetical protein
LADVTHQLVHFVSVPSVGFVGISVASQVHRYDPLSPENNRNQKEEEGNVNIITTKANVYTYKRISNKKE